MSVCVGLVFRLIDSDGRTEPVAIINQEKETNELTLERSVACSVEKPVEVGKPSALPLGNAAVDVISNCIVQGRIHSNN